MSKSPPVDTDQERPFGSTPSSCRSDPVVFAGPLSFGRHERMSQHLPYPRTNSPWAVPLKLAQPTSRPASSHSSVVSPLMAASRQA
jgi:hypothetical protein